MSLGNAQVQVAQDLQFAVRSAHVSAADGKIVLPRRQRSLQISLHVAVLELAERRHVRSEPGQTWRKTRFMSADGAAVHVNAPHHLELSKFNQANGRSRHFTVCFKLNCSSGGAFHLLGHTSSSRSFVLIYRSTPS